MENLLKYCNAANEEFQGMVNKLEMHENQISILMDLLKIPKEERNFEELRDNIENMIKENVNLTTYIQSQNDDGQDISRETTSPMEQIYLMKQIMSHLKMQGYFSKKFYLAILEIGISKLQSRAKKANSIF